MINDARSDNLAKRDNQNIALPSGDMKENGMIRRAP